MPVRKVLLVSLAGIGNYLMQSPTIALLKKNKPDWHVTVWVAPRGTKELAENDPHVDDVIEAPPKATPLEHIRLTYTLNRMGFDVGIVLSPGQLFKSAAYVWLANIPQRIGNTYPFRGNPRSGFLLTHPVDEQRDLHDIEQNIRLLEPLGITDQLPTIRQNTAGDCEAHAQGADPLAWRVNYRLSIPTAHDQEAMQLLSTLKVTRGKSLIGIHAGSAPDFLWKRWPAENFIAAANHFIATLNAHILLFGGPAETQLNLSISHQLKPHASVISTNLLTTAGLMKRCQFVLSNDSGLMHLAAASGAKTFGLLGPTDEKKTGPRGVDSHVIRAKGTQPAYDTEKNYHIKQTPHPTITAITSDLVIQEITSTI